MAARPLQESVAPPAAPLRSRTRKWWLLLCALSVVGALLYVVDFTSLRVRITAVQLSTASSTGQASTGDTSRAAPASETLLELPGTTDVDSKPLSHPSNANETKNGTEKALRSDDVSLESEDDTIRLPPPMQWPPQKGSPEECLYTRDYGVLERLANASRSFCSPGTNTSSSNSSSTYTVYHVPQTGLNAVKLSDWTLDLREVQVAHDIEKLEDDGGGHDPRFNYASQRALCHCTTPQDAAHGAPRIWHEALAGVPGDNYVNCYTPDSSAGGDLLEIESDLRLNRAVLISRKDDHNPFFQISGILNAWVALQVVGWSTNSTQLVTLDRGLPSPVDELRHAMLGPQRLPVDGEQLQHHVVRLESALVGPFEATGPMMSHLDDDQPCHANQLIADFRDEALRSLDISPRDAKQDPGRCLVTVISRRPYGGRRIQRVWKNEEEVLNQMRKEYKCEFQSLDFVDLSMREQMRVMLDSDVVIGMHGAGMVNVMWTRPETLVVEIFPKRRKRWGYRNLCQYLGCSWIDFRGGQDVRVTTTDPNAQDKTIPYEQWRTFFDPLFRRVLDKLETQADTAQETQVSS